MVNRQRPLSNQERAGSENNKFALSFMEQFAGGKKMQTFLSMFLSLVAVGLSVATTYLSFFDERYTLTLNIAKQELGVRTGFSKSGADKPANVTYQVFLTPTLILSNRGTRPLVLTDIKPKLSSKTESCDFSGPTRKVVSNDFWKIGSTIKPVIIEPGTVTELKYESNVGNTLTNDFETMSELWCLTFTIIDHRGARVEPAIKFSKLDYKITQNEKSLKNEGAPNLKVDVDYPKQPITLAKSGLF